MTGDPNDVSAFEAEAESGQGQGASEDKLAQISRLAARQQELEQKLKDLDEEQKRVKKEWLRVAQVDLPEAMDEINMAGIRLANGHEVEVEDGVDASITKANAPDAHAWLEANGFADLINREVKADLPREAPSLASELKEFLDRTGVPYNEREAVHPQRLKRFVREQLQKGVDIPEDLFGVYNYRRAKITPAK